MLYVARLLVELNQKRFQEFVVNLGLVHPHLLRRNKLEQAEIVVVFSPVLVS